MKARKTWLHAAVRAHQVKTLDHIQRTRHAWDELHAAEQRRVRASVNLESMGEAWASQRQAEPSSQEIDAAYLRFHGFLSDEEARARDAQQVCRELVDAAVADLQRSHAAQRTLEKVAKKKAEKFRHSVKTAELQANEEAWLLGRIASRSSHRQSAVEQSAELAGLPGEQASPRHLIGAGARAVDGLVLEECTSLERGEGEGVDGSSPGRLK